MTEARNHLPARRKTALVMAGGTGGHIFPGLAVAEALRQQGWQVHWLGVPGGMEGKLVPERGFALEGVDFGGVRGKGLKTLLALPWRLGKALGQALGVVRRVRPDVVLGFGGYITMPGGLAALLTRTPLMLHEQNSVAGMANKLLARHARKVFTAFPSVLSRGEWVGNPLRAAFLQQPAPAARFAGRFGALRLLVVGGSLGAKALNELVPQSLALLPASQRPQVLHQSGASQIDALRENYQKAQVEAELTPFIEETAAAFAQADLVLCRAGASTVTEIAAVGAAACFVPFPFAVDDHQTTNARHLVDAGAAWLEPQAGLDAQRLAAFLQGLTRDVLLERASKAHTLAKPDAVQAITRACEEVLA
ncbi:UDP-N-acetylglucosamine-N-acetylmuramylpentapeptide N-acetylglucosamine transferase [Lampropedia hyalina DSM 16112]|jgi:UDP-N-acetylglucosamine--N-acetylmuramyl-(pentapeptide) pyrophosphoryl-undecaprenol N-acetylglucosamine transferase|uniref:UDP-N-acetylglucosamine--N-acetylmuramyl-(pentapeptide) pyrophosphoryl-undecaprenol N-acetylglucosamine transferase n=1 Tax=Lampropedia hyalina DSM 16112 TaxID=1122156 RepID=A0A1M4T2C8_9BURK|nr:undecaprenyldiphospho-muramoylpentapeptide beta-N-acetylglucosaminyltransferase [Lampropedia hyalina]SHE38591.1 UDP-N-acetylglucosamine-N-acetylmuramylpentapeptide N-acetylglucosamine transferase [Lampropedia hyalina DSM 16112]